MSQVKQLQGVRLMLFEEVYDIFNKKRIGCDEASSALCPKFSSGHSP